MKLWAKAAWLAALVAFGGSGAYLYLLYHQAEKTARQIYVPIHREPVRPEGTAPPGGRSDAAPGAEDAREEPPPPIDSPIGRKDPFAVLLIGVDERKNDQGRSDSLMILAVNPQKKSTLLFSIPRDTRTDIVGHGTVDKINHAYAFGGVDMTVQTVEKFLDVPIPYYVEENMEGFSAAIDHLGGVDVNNRFAFEYGGVAFARGALHLDGKTALLYSRMRYDDPRGDLGRNERQRQIVQSVIRRSYRQKDVLHLSQMLDNVRENLRTNIAFDEMKKLRLDYGSTLESIRTDEIRGENEIIDQIYYYAVSDRELERIRGEVKAQLAVDSGPAGSGQAVNSRQAANSGRAMSSG